MSKAVWSWDGDKVLIPGAKIVNDDYKLAGNETFEEPLDADGRGLLMPIKRVNGQWRGATQEEYEAAHPAQPVTPSATAQAIQALGLQVMALSAKVDALTNGGAE